MLRGRRLSLPQSPLPPPWSLPHRPIHQRPAEHHLVRIFSPHYYSSHANGASNNDPSAASPVVRTHPAQDKPLIRKTSSARADARLRHPSPILPPTREEKKAKRKEILKQRSQWRREQQMEATPTMTTTTTAQAASSAAGATAAPDAMQQKIHGQRVYLERRRKMVEQFEMEKAKAASGQSSVPVDLPQENKQEEIKKDEPTMKLEDAPQDQPKDKIQYRETTTKAKVVKEMKPSAVPSDTTDQAKPAAAQAPPQPTSKDDTTRNLPPYQTSSQGVRQKPQLPPEALGYDLPGIPRPVPNINFDQQLSVFLAGKSSKSSFSPTPPTLQFQEPKRFSVRPTWMPFEPIARLTPLPKKTVQKRKPPPPPQQVVQQTEPALQASSSSEGRHERLAPVEESTESAADRFDRLPSDEDAMDEIDADDEESASQRSGEDSVSNTKLDPAKIPLLLRKPRLDPRRRISPGGLHKILFPETESSSPEKPPQPAAESAASKEDAIFNSLRNEIRNWIPEDQLHEVTGPEPGEYGSQATVVTLSGASPSLVDTDFYRIMPSSRYVEGWAGGLIKIVQARDPLSHLPIGHYYLMFHSRPPADAFVAEARRLYALARRLLHPAAQSGVIPVRGALADAPRAIPSPFLTAEEKAAVRRFTLCAPTTPLRLHTAMWNAQFRLTLATRTAIADVLQPLSPEVVTPAKVLLNIRGRQQGHALEGGHGMTADELWLTLRDDGRERGSPWVLSSLREGLAPVRTIVEPDLVSPQRRGKVRVATETLDLGLELDPLAREETDVELGQPIVGDLLPPPQEKVAQQLQQREEQMWQAVESSDSAGEKPSALDPSNAFIQGPSLALELRERRYNRFLLTFVEPAMARRFVRAWHRRAVWDGELSRVFVVDAVSIV